MANLQELINKAKCLEKNIIDKEEKIEDLKNEVSNLYNEAIEFRNDIMSAFIETKDFDNIIKEIILEDGYSCINRDSLKGLNGYDQIEDFWKGIYTNFDILRSIDYLNYNEDVRHKANEKVSGIINEFIRKFKEE